MEGALLWLVRWASLAGKKRYLSCLGWSFVPIAQQAGQADVLGRLFLIMRLWLVRTLRSFYSSFLSVTTTKKKEKKWPFSSNNFMCGPKYHEL
jgi:hypothetical protein